MFNFVQIPLVQNDIKKMKEHKIALLITKIP